LLNPAILVIGAMVWQLISSSHFILGYLTTSINVKGISWQREMSTPRIGKTIALEELSFWIADEVMGNLASAYRQTPRV